MAGPTAVLATAGVEEEVHRPTQQLLYDNGTHLVPSVTHEHNLRLVLAWHEHLKEGRHRHNTVAYRDCQID